MDEATRKTAILLYAKGRELPAFLASLDPMTRLRAVSAMNDFFPMGPSLYEVWLRYPNLFAEKMGETEMAKLDQLAALAKNEIRSWSAAGGSLVEALIEAITSAVEGSGTEVHVIEVPAEQSEPSPMPPGTQLPQPTETTDMDSLIRSREQGIAGWN